MSTTNSTPTGDAVRRVSAFLDRWAEMRSNDQTLIYRIGDRDGELLELTPQDLRALVAAAR